MTGLNVDKCLEVGLVTRMWDPWEMFRALSNR